MEEVKNFAVPIEDPKCPEHCYSCCLNPTQHPRLYTHIHHVVALLKALCNTCGGVIFLTAPEGTGDDEINFCRFEHRLREMLLASGFPEGLVETYQRDECDTAFWAIIVAKKSHQMLPYSIGGNAYNFQIDVHRRISLKVVTMETPEVSKNKENMESLNSTGVHSRKQSIDEQSFDAEYAASCKSANWVDVDELTWGRNKNNWDNILKAADQSYDSCVGSYDIWKPSSPMRVTPDRQSLKYLFRTDAECSEVLEKLNTQIPGFAIASRSWLSFLSETDVETQPDSHLCDILTVAQDNEVCLWVIVSESGEQVIHTQLHYMLTVGRNIKHKILNQNKKGPNITIRCRLCSTQVVENEFIEKHEKYVLIQNTQEMISLKFQERNHSGALRQCIASLLLSKQTAISTCIGQQMSLMLSANMVKTRLVLGGQKVTYVDAPPGTGKTVCGLSLYREYGEQRSVYICPTQPLIQYLQYNGYCGILVRTDEDLCSHIHNSTFTDKKCVVIDESHHLRWSRESWEKLFMLLKKNRSMFLFVFADNKFQCFESCHRNEVSNWIYELSNKVLDQPAHITSFPYVYRNTRKVVSFLQHTALGMATTDMNVKYANDLDGDGIQCKVMGNLWGNGPENSLVRYLLPIFAHTSSSWDITYNATEVAVLLDAGYTDEKIETINQILRAQLPGVTTHVSDKFPREGIVVDRIESFIGLDAGLCIFLLPSKGEQQIIEDPRYRIFLASRATHKAVFVVSKIDAAFAEKIEVRSLSGK